MKSRQPIRSQIYKRLLPLIPNKRYLSWLVVIKIALLITGVVSPLFYKIFVDNVLINKQITLLLPVIIGYIGIFVIETGLIFTQRVVHNKCFQLFCTRLRIGLLKKFIAIPAKDYITFNAGDLNLRVQSDVNACQDFFSKQIVDYTYHLCVMIVYSAVLLYICWPLALFGFAMIPLSFLLTKTLKRKGGIVSEQYRNEYGKYEGFVYTSLQSWREIKALNMEKQESEKFTAHWNKLSPLFVKQQIYWFLNRSIIAFKDLFITRMNLYFIGGLLIFNGQLSVGDLLVYMVYYETFFSSVSAINELDISLTSQKPSIDRVLEILDRNDVFMREQRLHNFKDAIVFNGVTFTYRDSPVLKNINLTIKPGEKVAVVGKSGSGKTTLICLIMNLYEPDDGTIMLDGTVLSQLEKQSLYKIVGHIAQEPYLFNLSIRENFFMADNNADESRFDEVCQIAQIYEFIQSLPDKYDTIIGERGIKLSGGQKQRLAIARALLTDTPVLIFDEATSALDYEVEHLVQLNLEKYLQGRTIIKIAHRLSAIKSCERIIVIDEGYIVGDGSHDELMNDCTIYQTLFKQ